MHLVDFDNSPVDYTAAYGGNAGKKYGILYEGARWMLKFPESTATFPGNRTALPSYTSSALSEYIGSQVYRILGIDVHEVRLGLRDGKVVAACRDFDPARQMITYSMARNFLDIDDGLTSSGSSGRGEPLNDCLAALQKSPLLAATPGITERFWEMFVVDAVIRNNDRNNGNWGIFIRESGNVCAPVFDNGNALFNKRNPSLALESAADDRLFTEDAFATGVSFFTDSDGNHIHPFDFMARTQNTDCKAAVIRIAQRADMQAIYETVDAIPEEYAGKPVLPRAVANHYKALLGKTIEEGLIPIARAISS